MKLELTDKETKTLVEMLTMVGYVMTEASDQTIAKAENMHELIQKIYQQAQSTCMQKDFDQDQGSQMIFPNAEVMSGTEDSPLYLLKSYNEFAAADVLSQQLGLRDAAKELNMNIEKQTGELNPQFIEAFGKHQSSYLEEFAENGFTNLQITRIQLA